MGALPTSQGGAPSGGTTGQVLQKNTNSDFDYSWTTSSNVITPSTLSRVNDTNVTLTLSGVPGTALLQPVGLTLGWAGTLAISRGGTGASSTAAHTFFANNTGSSAAPSWTLFRAGVDYWDTTDFSGVAHGLVPQPFGVPTCLRFLDENGSWTCASGGSAGGAPDNAHYVTTQAESDLTNEFNLGALTTGILKGTVSTGVSTISSVSDTTVGDNFLTLSNPSAITWARINADNSITTRSASETRTDLSLVPGTNVQAWDVQLDSLSALSYTGNSLKVVRVNSGETGFELATVTSGGTIASTTQILKGDNAGNAAAGEDAAPTWTGPHSFSEARTISSGASATWDDVKFPQTTTTVTGTTTISTATGFNRVSIYTPTVTDSSAVTINDAASLYIQSGPVSGGSASLARTYALWVNAGNVRFDGGFRFAQATPTPGSFPQASSGSYGDSTYTLPASIPIADKILVTASGSVVASNKPRIAPRTNSTTSATSWTPNFDSYDEEIQTALAGAVTINAPTYSTTNEGEKKILRIKDNGTARAITWNGVYRAGSSVALPTTTTISKTLYCGFMYNSTDSKWDLMAYTDGY